MSKHPSATGVARMTIHELQAMAHRAEPIAVVTAYDATFARMFDDGGADVLLVGDSLGMVVQGLDTTLPVTMDDMLYHCRAVARGARRAHLVGDMPFMSYHASETEALRNAGRFMAEGGMHSVKLEGGTEMAGTIARICASGIPVMGHVGLKPQSVHAMGGFKVQGKDAASAAGILADAQAVQAAGAYAVVLEGIPKSLAATVTAALSIPTIGIGAGAQCAGQVLVGYDMLGLTPTRVPKFVRKFADFYQDGVQAMVQYKKEVQQGTFPSDQESFGAGAPTANPASLNRATGKAHP